MQKDGNGEKIKGGGKGNLSRKRRVGTALQRTGNDTPFALLALVMGEDTIAQCLKMLSYRSNGAEEGDSVFSKKKGNNAKSPRVGVLLVW